MSVKSQIMVCGEELRNDKMVLKVKNNHLFSVHIISDELLLYVS